MKKIVLDALLIGSMIVGGTALSSSLGTAQEAQTAPHGQRHLQQMLANPPQFKNTPFTYPASAPHDSISRVVYLCTHVTKEGTVSYVHVTKSSGQAILDSSAVQDLKQYTFKPGYDLKGNAVDAVVRVQVGFA
jgi:TonB family protein